MQNLIYNQKPHNITAMGFYFIRKLKTNNLKAPPS